MSFGERWRERVFPLTQSLDHKLCYVTVTFGSVYICLDLVTTTGLMAASLSPLSNLLTPASPFPPLKARFYYMMKPYHLYNFVAKLQGSSWAFRLKKYTHVLPLEKGWKLL